MPTEKVFRAVVAILLGIEAAALLYCGGTYIPPYLAIAIIVAGLVLPIIRRWHKIAFAIVATAYAVLFIAPGAILIAIGACGTPVNGHCSDDEFRAAMIGFAVAATVNITAAVLIWRRRPSKPPPPESRT